MKKILNISVCAAILFATACQEEKLLDLQSTSESVIQKRDGRLFFASLSSYEETMKKIVSMSQEEMDAWESSLDFAS